IFADRELFRVRTNMPAIDQFVLDWIDYTEAVGGFIRRCAIFVQAGGHSRRATQCHKNPFSVWSGMNASRPFACLERGDNGVRRSVNHADISRSFIADVDE